VLAGGLAVYLFNVVRSLRAGAPAPANPWQASSLEWGTSSPPPAFNFCPLPAVMSRDPLWEDPEPRPVVVGVSPACREVLVTHVLDAEPDHVKEFPKPSVWPFVTAVATTGMFIGSIFTPWAVVIGAVPVAIGLTAWFWPREGKPPAELERDIAEGRFTPLEQTQ
jgi:hypothetical protein